MKNLISACEYNAEQVAMQSIQCSQTLKKWQWHHSSTIGWCSSPTSLVFFLFQRIYNMSTGNSQSGLKSFNRWIYVPIFTVIEQHLAEI